MRKKKGIEDRKRLWLAGTLLAACFLCGCTKKEEVFLLREEAVPEAAVRQEAATENGEANRADEDGAPPPTQEDDAAFRKAGVSAEEMSAESSPLCVHVCGAVNMPGVYELPAGSRVYAAVQAAGGFTADAEQNYVNQAQPLTDGVKLVIPTVEEAAKAEGGETAAEGGRQNCDAAEQENREVLQIGIVGGEESPEGEAAERTHKKININTAAKQELCEIPGVGETRAAAIISYRESHGRFAAPEDIMKVNGIKEGMYNKIKESICVD